MYKIIYYAPTSSLNETEEQVKKFRTWAKIKLAMAYPDYETEVSEEANLLTVWTDDEENREKITEDVRNLWDRYPGDWWCYIAVSG